MILGSCLAGIDSTVVAVALPAIRTEPETVDWIRVYLSFGLLCDDIPDA
jgi:hypothetical protein